MKRHTFFLTILTIGLVCASIGVYIDNKWIGVLGMSIMGFSALIGI